MFDYLIDNEFLEQLLLTTTKEYFLKIELLDFSEEVIEEIQGKCISGSVTIDGSSSVRRSCALSLVVDEQTFDITNISNLLSLNKKFKLYSGYKNNLLHYSHYGNTIWFPLGVFVVTNISINNSLGGNTINLSGKDKMCLLNGEVGGKLPAPVVLHEKYIRNDDGTTTIVPALLYDIVRESVIELGELDPSKVIINDLPIKIKKVLRYIGKDTLYFSENGNQLESEEGSSRTVKSGELAGYDYVDFTYPGELIKSAGDTVASILDSIKNILGNYEYFFDVEGRFIFQEKKNYLNTSYTPITELTTGDYQMNIDQGHLAYQFKNSNIITSYANNPNYLNIKNDFIVWGSRETDSGAEIPIRYHVAIDDKPRGGSDSIPWQVKLYNYGLEAEKLGRNAGYYYRELKSEIPKIYDFEKNQWKEGIDPANMDYFLDFIDTNSELGKFSVNAIGRRTEVVSDPEVKMLYRPETPDYVILEKDNPDNLSTIQELNKKGQKFIVVENRQAYKYAAVGKDAFSVIRDMLFQYTTYNESVTITSLPIYTLEPNVRISIEDERSNIYGEYIIKSMSLPLAPEGTMSLTALRAVNRI